MMDLEGIEARNWPEPGETWRHCTGSYYVISGHSVHAETQETMVICRSYTPPYTSIAYPLALFMGHVESTGHEPRFVRIEGP
jgi:hypothetical protein